MNIELKNIRVYERLSEETNAFTATLYVNKYRVAECRNDGHGGCTLIDVRYNDKTAKELYSQAEEYCLNLPPHKSNYGDLKMDLEFFVDLEIGKFLAKKDEQKFQKKLQKDMLKGICYGDEKQYKCLSWKKLTLSDLIKHPKGIDILKNEVTKLKDRGENILNTNLQGVI